MLVIQFISIDFKNAEAAKTRRTQRNDYLMYALSGRINLEQMGRG